MILVIKCGGYPQEFVEDKVFRSCYRACLNAHLTPQEATQIAESVVRDVNNWSGDQEELYTDDLKQKITSFIEPRDTDAAYMYRTHLDIN